MTSAFHRRRLARVALCLPLLALVAAEGSRAQALAPTVTAGSTGFVRQIVGTTLASVPLYANPGDAAPATSVPINSFPWTVLEEKQDFYRINFQGRDYWVDSMQVQATRASKNVSCVTVAGQAAAPVGATPGAGENSCRR